MLLGRSWVLPGEQTVQIREFLQTVGAGRSLQLWLRAAQDSAWPSAEGESPFASRALSSRRRSRIRGKFIVVVGPGTATIGAANVKRRGHAAEGCTQQPAQDSEGERYARASGPLRSHGRTQTKTDESADRSVSAAW
jgi:hypothetical protein